MSKQGLTCLESDKDAFFLEAFTVCLFDFFSGWTSCDCWLCHSVFNLSKASDHYSPDNIVINRISYFQVSCRRMFVIYGTVRDRVQRWAPDDTPKLSSNRATLALVLDLCTSCHSASWIKKNVRRLSFRVIALGFSFHARVYVEAQSRGILKERSLIRKEGYYRTGIGAIFVCFESFRKFSYVPSLAYFLSTATISSYHDTWILRSPTVGSVCTLVRF